VAASQANRTAARPQKPDTGIKGGFCDVIFSSGLATGFRCLCAGVYADRFFGCADAD